MITWKNCYRVGITIFILYLCIHYFDTFMYFLGVALGAAMPIILGVVIAYVTNILMSFYENILAKIIPNIKRKMLRRVLCMLLSFVSIFTVFIIIVITIIPELYKAITLLFLNIPSTIQSTYHWLQTNYDIDAYLSEQLNEALGSTATIREWMQDIGDILFQGIGGAMSSIMAVMSSFFSIMITMLVSFIFSIYILTGKESIVGQMKRVAKAYLDQCFIEKTAHILAVLDESFHNFIVGQCMEAVIIGVLCSIGMLLFRFPYATMIGSLIGCTALIPVAGAYIGGLTGAFLIFTVSPMQALGFLVFLVILQQLEDNLIYPRVVGSSIGLPGLWVLAAVTVGGAMMGVVGMLVGVPIAATIYKLVRDDVNRRNTSQGMKPRRGKIRIFRSF